MKYLYYQKFINNNLISYKFNFKSIKVCVYIYMHTYNIIYTFLKKSYIHLNQV